MFCNSNKNFQRKKWFKAVFDSNFYCQILLILKFCMQFSWPGLNYFKNYYSLFMHILYKNVNICEIVKRVVQQKVRKYKNNIFSYFYYGYIIKNNVIRNRWIFIKKIPKLFSFGRIFLKEYFFFIFKFDTLAIFWIISIIIN